MFPIIKIDQDGPGGPGGLGVADVSASVFDDVDPFGAMVTVYATPSMTARTSALSSCIVIHCLSRSLAALMRGRREDARLDLRRRAEQYARAKPQ